MSDYSEELIEVDSIKINWRSKGQGRPLLFLHGAGGVMEWLPFYDRLAQYRRLHVPDHPGFGASDEPASLNEVTDIVAHYLRVLEHLGLSRLDVVGTSLGGWIAAEIALRCPTAVKTLILFAPAGIVDPAHPPANLFVWDGQLLARNLFQNDSYAQRMLDRPATEQMVRLLEKNRRTAVTVASNPLLQSSFLEHSAKRLVQPTLIVWGRDDKIIPVETSSAWADRVPNAELCIFDECGHLPFVEKAEESFEKTLLFLDEARVETDETVQ